jgi:GNAT superfamily N-acetyltransferase
MSRREAIFGFFECLDDEEAAHSLFDAVRAWARARGLDSLHGPFNLDYEDGYGVLVEGRDRPPVLLCGHSPQYYQRLVEGYGFAPARADNIAYAVPLSADLPEWRRVERLADRVRKRGWITVRIPDPRRWRDEVDVIRELLNRALAHLEDFLPWSREMVEGMLAQFVRVVDPELVLFAEVEGRTVGWFPGVKNLNEALIHANGLRRPWDWVRLALAMRRKPACLAVKSVLILPEYWRSGVAILLFDEMRRRAQARGYQWVDLSLTSLDNPYTPDLATRMGGTIYKRYRVYRIEA